MFPISRRDLLKQTLAAGVGASYLGNRSILGAEANEPLSIGSRRQLFLDDVVIAEMKNLERTWHQAEKRPEPVVAPDRPNDFEGVMLFPGDVLYDEQERIFKMWYSSPEYVPPPPRKPGNAYVIRWHLSYATSKDGVHWEKPNLGQVMFQGNTNNNLVFDSVTSNANPKHVWLYRQVLLDPHDSDPSRRYKAVGFSGTFPWDGNSPFWGVSVAFSPDGLHWTDYPKNPVIHAVGDEGAFSIGWVEALGKYVMYVRVIQAPRQTGVCFSDDFVHWSESKIIAGPEPGDPKDLQIYGMGARRYQDLYVGTEWIFRTAPELVVSPIFSELVFSRDAIRWIRPTPGRYFLTLGSPGAFDDCMAFACSPLEVGDELFFYYTGADYPHNDAMITGAPGAAVGLAKMRRDGFVSLDSRTNDGSEMATVPLRCEGKALVVNARAKQGSINVAVLDQDRTPIPGFGHQECTAFVGDEVRHRVAWADGRRLAELNGRTVRLRFQIRNAELYSFAFSE